ncbi:prephenate dehydratase [Roseivirga misakiensis]|uniref:prephenate dehydratase n=1 Tax=Roseivirga misakiensis TaxID=1563681 RepID=A0A1E5T0P3_9BACT|nr:prephenate dehydratase domain-containing protein [Roseivirga misakiensis]OEK04931.1 hypothetical protein BFP71_15965 [Roseivirga misakiensis]
MKIGYQGVLHSHNHAAALAVTEEMQLTEGSFELVPLISSKNVVEALLSGEVEYGLMAVQNSIGGVVKESQEALLDKDLELVKEVILSISHSTFKLNNSIKNDDITEVISHPQALKQCATNLKRIYPNAMVAPVENTALAPKYVVEGKFGKNTAVVCAKVAGEYYKMTLVEEGIQDKSDNRTTFNMFRVPLTR